METHRAGFLVVMLLLATTVTSSGSDSDGSQTAQSTLISSKTISDTALAKAFLRVRRASWGCGSQRPWKDEEEDEVESVSLQWRSSSTSTLKRKKRGC